MTEDDGAARSASLRERLPAAVPALLGYVLVRAVGLIVLWLFARDANVDFWWLLHSRFDSGWYQQIAERGYDTAIQFRPNGTPRPMNLAFFPLYPALIALVTAVTPLPPPIAGLVISWPAGIATAWGLYAIGNHLRSRATGVLLAVLWGVYPYAVVENMAYSEPLFTALAAWSVYAVLTRRWLTAGVLCLLAGLTRPTAAAIVVAVGLSALVAAVRRQDGWRPWVAMLLAPLGLFGYLAWVGHMFGRADGYSYMQRKTWRITFDGGADTLRSVTTVLTEPSRLAFYMVTFLIVLAVALTVILLMDRYPLPVVAYSVATVVFVCGAAGAYYGKGRYLLGGFTLLLPVAAGLARAPVRTRVAVLTLLTLISAWYGAYLTLDWGASP